MKWKNKGHEFDSVYQSIISKKRFYLFGAGDYGRQFIHIFKDEIEIIGFIDNNIEKQGRTLEGLQCIPFEKIEKDSTVGVILTMSQIARTNPLLQLKDAGFVLGRDCFLIEEFLSVYYVYKYNRVYFSSISFLPSTACNLKCKNCLNFNPYTKRFYVREWNKVIADIDLFFSCVDRVMLFHVSGGEPMLYRPIADLIEYIDKKYGDRIDTLRTVTNGTVIPSDAVLDKLSHCRVEITVDDYRESVPEYRKNFQQLLDKLEQYKIKYYINKVESWIALSPLSTDYSDWSEEALEQHFNECAQSWQELRDGKLYSCNYDAYATVAGINPEPDAEIYELGCFTEDKKKELVEFRLGYNGKGYTNLCRHCKGFVLSNAVEYKPAEQIICEDRGESEL